MTQPDELPIFPVTGWTIGTVPDHNAVFIQLSFLASSMQKFSQPDPGRRYVLQLNQLRELQHDIAVAIDKLESDSSQLQPDQFH